MNVRNCPSYFLHRNTENLNLNVKVYKGCIGQYILDKYIECWEYYYSSCSSAKFLPQPTLNNSWWPIGPTDSWATYHLPSTDYLLPPATCQLLSANCHMPLAACKSQPAKNPPTKIQQLKFTRKNPPRKTCPK